MKISYGKMNLLVLLGSLTLGGAILYGIVHFYVQPLEAAKEQAQAQLQLVESQQATLREQRAQVEIIEGNTESIDNVTTLIPFGGLQPESLLATLAEAAETAGIRILDHQFGTGTPVFAPVEAPETDEAIPNLIRTSLTLSLNGENSEDFQEFIRLLEESSRLIQVEIFTVDQDISRITAAKQTLGADTTNLVRFLSTNIEEDENNETDAGKGGLESKDGTDEQTDLEENQDGTNSEENHQETNTETNQENTDTEETPLEQTPSASETPTPQPSTMRASVTIVVYFFEA